MEKGIVVVGGIIFWSVVVLAVVRFMRPSMPLPRITSSEVSPEVHRSAVSPSEPPLTAKAIFWAVFGALWAFSISAGLLYLILRSLNS